MVPMILLQIVYMVSPGVTVICVSPLYVYPRTHIPSDMCIPGGDTINTDAHPRHNKEISSLAKGNVVDII